MTTENTVKTAKLFIDTIYNNYVALRQLTDLEAGVAKYKGINLSKCADKLSQSLTDLSKEEIFAALETIATDVCPATDSWKTTTVAGEVIVYSKKFLVGTSINCVSPCVVHNCKECSFMKYDPSMKFYELMNQFIAKYPEATNVIIYKDALKQFTVKF